MLLFCGIYLHTKAKYNFIYLFIFIFKLQSKELWLCFMLCHRTRRTSVGVIFKTEDQFQVICIEMLYLCFAQSFRCFCLHSLFPWHCRFLSMAMYQQTPTPHRLQSARHDCCPVANPEYKGFISCLCGAFSQVFYSRSEQWSDLLNGSVAPFLSPPQIFRLLPGSVWFSLSALLLAFP